MFEVNNSIKKSLSQDFLFIWGCGLQIDEGNGEEVN